MESSFTVWKLPAAYSVLPSALAARARIVDSGDGSKPVTRPRFAPDVVVNAARESLAVGVPSAGSPPWVPLTELNRPPTYSVAPSGESANALAVPDGPSAG